MSLRNADKVACHRASYQMLPVHMQSLEISVEAVKWDKLDCLREHIALANGKALTSRTYHPKVRVA